MARKLSPQQLEKRLGECQERYARIKARIRDVGFICEGSLVERWTTCGKANCRCAGDPPQRHGPYHQLTWKERGKTVTRRLTPNEAQLYKDWTSNRRELEGLLQQMREVSREAGTYLLGAAAAPGKTPDAPPPRPRSRKPKST